MCKQICRWCGWVKKQVNGYSCTRCPQPVHPNEYRTCWSTAFEAHLIAQTEEQAKKNQSLRESFESFHSRLSDEFHESVCLENSIADLLWDLEREHGKPNVVLKENKKA